MIPPLFPLRDESRVNRRSFLMASAGSLSLAAAAVWSSRSEGAIRRRLALADHPFQLGTASGDPAPDSVAIWTRLAPKPLEGGGMPPEPVQVDWQVAEDEKMTKIVRKGTTTATPEWGHSVHVEVEGLRPDRWHWFQFRAAGELSPIGRTRTMPQPDALPDSLKFAFASCQHFESGLFTAYEHMAREELDLVLHLGDYIYEGAGKTGAVRKHIGPKLNSLEDYRNRHAQYKTDPALQAVHGLYPWIVTWDDHEVENNYADAVSENPKVAADAFLKQRARAYQAYYEHMPLRRSSLPQGPNMKLYRRLAFGRLADFFVLDTRQYRTDQPCGDGNKPPCPESENPKATLLGDRQEEWLKAGLAASGASWKTLAQQVMMARVDRAAGPLTAYSMDQWPGYEANRRRILQFLHERKIANPVVLTGDIHSHWANDLVREPDADSPSPQIVGAEFVGTSISSGGNGSTSQANAERLASENPFVKFFNAERGYVSCRLTPSQWRSDYRTVEYVTRPGAPLLTRASFVLEDGRPGLQKA